MLEPVRQRFVAGKGLRRDGPQVVPMRVSVAVVVSQHAAVVATENQRVDVGERIAD